MDSDVLVIGAGPAGLAVAASLKAKGRAATRSGRAFHSQAVAVTTGANHQPFVPEIEGADAFAGTVVHSHAYRNAAPFAGRRVLVVGMGNTGAEIALDLAEQGVAVALSV